MPPFDPSKLNLAKPEENDKEAADLDQLAKELGALNQVNKEIANLPKEDDPAKVIQISEAELYANERTLLRSKILDGIKSLLKDSGMDTQQQDKFCVGLQKLIGN